MERKKDKIRECVTCWRWDTLREHDFVSGLCGLTGTQTPARYGCSWWIDHPGEVSLAEQLERKRQAEEAARKRHEEELRQQQAMAQKKREEAALRREPSERTRQRVKTCWRRLAPLINDEAQLVRTVSARAGASEETVRKVIGITNNE